MSKSKPVHNLRFEEPMLLTELTSTVLEQLNDLKRALNAYMVEQLTELARPYFDELDYLIMHGDPTDEISSGRLFARHFPDDPADPIVSRPTLNNGDLSDLSDGRTDNDTDKRTDKSGGVSGSNTGDTAPDI